MYRLCNYKAMSLIEVIIALAIFSIISLYTVSSTTRGFRISQKTSNENDYYHVLRTALRHIQKDISLAYHAFNDTKLGYFYRENYINQISDYDYIRESFFIGDKDKLTFTSTSNRRMYKNTKESEFCEISYYLDRDISEPDVLNLYKRKSLYIDENMHEGGNTYILVSNIETIKFRYFSTKSFSMEGKWFDKWNSVEGEFEHVFPEAVEVEVVLKSSLLNDKTNKIIEIIKILNPNNISQSEGFKKGQNINNEFEEVE